MSKGITLPFRVGISPTLHIRGLIATRKIKKDEVVERCPAVVYPKKPHIIAQTIFDHYVFEWDDTHEALALGYGSLCNHSYERNVYVDFDYDTKEFFFTALRDIVEGEELLISYSDDEEHPVDADYLSLDKELNN